MYESVEHSKLIDSNGILWIKPKYFRTYSKSEFSTFSDYLIYDNQETALFADSRSIHSKKFYDLISYLSMHNSNNPFVNTSWVDFDEDRVIYC